MQSCVLQRVLSRGVGSWRHAAAAALLVSLRHLSRDIGQPTHHSHPHLLAEGESERIYPHVSQGARESYEVAFLYIAAVLPGMHQSEFAARRTVLMAYVFLMLRFFHLH